MGTAQQCAAHHCAQVVGVLNAVAQHQKRRFPLCLCCRQQVVYGCIFDLAGKSRHALMALGAGHQAQFVGVHPLHRCARLFGQRRIIGGHSRGHALSDEHRIHTRAALQKLGHRIFAIDKALVFRLVFFRVPARAAGLILFFHVVSPFAVSRAAAGTFRKARVLWAAHRYEHC